MEFKSRKKGWKMKIIFIALYQEWKLFYEQHRSELILLNRESKEWVYLFKDKVIIYQTGMGPIHKLTFLESIIKKYTINHVYNFGFSGLLHSNEPVGTIFIPDKIGFLSHNQIYINQKEKRVESIGKSIEILYTTDQIIEKPNQVNAETRPFLVDMEAFYLAEKINQHHIPFTVIKIVSDYGTKESVRDVMKIHLPLLQKKMKYILNELILLFSY
jgi:hypothetical protein